MHPFGSDEIFMPLINSTDHVEILGQNEGFQHGQWSLLLATRNSSKMETCFIFKASANTNMWYFEKLPHIRVGEGFQYCEW